ncbi:hypothetical protein [Feifania hominis]|uniref:Uncharacterized protein n=1 Tax=Feifania hominis TaxID=2763660 RepID=A0A926HVA7_9FIRM|nr:hypothetical protein [Feifania hominis]MBC8536421.1 hypothetical protein [Feifania hominis]
MKKYAANPVGLGVFAGSVLILLLLEAVYLALGNFPAAALFLGLIVLYAAFHVSSLHTVHLSRKGISKHILGFQSAAYHWSEIREVGVLYPKVTKRLGKNRRAGQCFIYFSPRKMDSQTRLKACVNWPPKDIIAMTYTPERFRQSVSLWDGKFVFFNITTRELFGQDTALFDFDVQEIRY